MKSIRLSAHARSYMARRGFSIAEVEDVIRAAAWQPAERGRGRFEAVKEYDFQREWNGRRYATKQVRPVFVEEAVEIVVVTVYTYYY